MVSIKIIKRVLKGPIAGGKCRCAAPPRLASHVKGSGLSLVRGSVRESEDILLSDRESRGQKDVRRRHLRFVRVRPPASTQEKAYFTIKSIKLAILLKGG